MPPTFTWDKATLRFRYTSGAKNGRFVSAQDLAALSNGYIRYRKQSFQAVTQTLLNGHISVTTWMNAIASELKESHITAFALGRGGTKQLTQRDYGLIGSRLKAEYTYLHQFAQDILAGKLSKAQILNRMALYQDSLHTTYSLGFEEANRVAGARWERWIAVDDGGTCSGCSDKDSRGWQPFGSLGIPGVGVPCRSRCRCRKEYSSAIIMPKDSAKPMLAMSYGWLR